MEALAILLVTAGVAGCVGETSSRPAEPASADNATEADREAGDNGTSEATADNGTREEASGNATASNGTASGTSGPEPGTVVAEGQIRAGSFTTNVLSTASGTDCGVQGVDSFCFEDPPTDVTLQTRTETASPRYNIDVYFHNDTSGYLGGCNQGSASPTGAGDEANCTVPPEADWGTVDATLGVDLSVELVVQASEGS